MNQQSLSPEKKDELLTLTASHSRRIILSYLRDEPDNSATVGELLEQLVDETDLDEDGATLQLLHTDLPKMEKSDIIEYDPRHKTVRYQKSLILEGLMRSISNL